MVMSLPKLLSICCLLGIVFTTPLPSPMAFRRELKDFKTRMEDKCGTLKGQPCSKQKVRAIEFKVNCSSTHYQKMFCQVKSVLKELSQTECNRTLSTVQIAPVLLGDPLKSNCSSSNPHQGYILLDDFCTKVKSYAGNLFGSCAKDLQQHI